MKSTGNKFRDTVALTVRADGKDIPPFLIKGQVGNASKASGRRPKKGEKPIRGMNKVLMKKYVEHISHYVEEPSLLILDRASSHTSREVLYEIEDYLTADGRPLLKPLLLPAKTAFLLSPLDNGAISAFKQHFYDYDRSTFEKKKIAVKLAWDEVSNDSLLHFAIQCGLNGNDSLSAIRDRFEKNVHGFIPEELQESLDFFEMWDARAVEVDGTENHRRVERKPPVQLEGSTMDGIKWVAWGAQ